MPQFPGDMHTNTIIQCCCSVPKSRLFATPRSVALHAPLSWGFPSKNTGVGCHFLLQGIFLTQGSNMCLLHWQLGSSLLSQQGSPNHTVKPTQTQINKGTHHTDITQLHPDQGEGVGETTNNFLKLFSLPWYRGSRIH